PISREEKITSVIHVSEFSEDEYLVMLTHNGYIKKTALAAFSRIRANGLIAISLEEGDQLRWVRLAREEDSIIIGSRQGMAIHFKADRQQLRPLGRSTRGVKSMKLRSGDEIISMDVLPSQVTAEVASAAEEEDEHLEETNEETTVTEPGQGPWVLAITRGGYGKRVSVKKFRLQNRAGMGLRGMKFRIDRDELIALHVVNQDDELMLVTNRGIIIRQAVESISSQSRMATGVRVQKLDKDDAIVAVALVPPSEKEGEEAIEEVQEGEEVKEVEDV
ncbi:MAG: DNA gyrase subunit A, partial [Okeania sp. SIO2D1]|nr:DNA gyrase subunit A [Okeania sp. SIO2D1]